MKRIIRLLLLLIITCATLNGIGTAIAADIPKSSPPQNAETVAVVVNDDVITTVDIENRLNIALAATGLPNKPEIRQHLLPQIVQVLIDETLYKQEAKRLKLTITDDEYKHAISTIEKQNKVGEGNMPTFLKKYHIPEYAFRDQLDAQLLWNKIISKRIRPTITVTDTEIQEALEHIMARTGASEILLSEIVLPVEKSSDEKEIKALALKLYQELEGGAPFEMVARQFSRSPTAEEGGEIGWVEQSELPKEIAAALDQAPVGAMLQPMRTGDGYTIYKINDRKGTKETGLTNQVTVTLRQVFVPYGENKATVLETLKTAAEKISNCEDFDPLASAVKSSVSTERTTYNLEDLRGSLRKTISEMKVGTVSPVVEEDAGAHVVALCERAEGGIKLPDKAAVGDKILQRKLSLQARRTLRDLRREAFIEIRL